MKNQTKPLVIVPENTPETTLKEIRSAGYVPIPCDDTDKVVLLQNHSAPFQPNDLLMSALYGMSDTGLSSTERSRAMLELYRRLKAREEKK